MGALTIAWIGGGLTVVLIFLILSPLIKLILNIIYLYRAYPKDKNQTIKAIDKRILHILSDKVLIITTISVLALTLFNNVDIIIVKKFFSGYDAGIYASWSLFAKIILYFIGPVSMVSFIFFTSNKDTTKEHRALQGSLIILAFIGICSYIGYTYFGKPMIHLFFGTKFDAVIPYLSQASLFGTFYTAITFINNYFIAKKNKAALILPAIIPFYAGALILQRQSIESILQVNVWFGAVTTLIYLGMYISGLKKGYEVERSNS
jgi:O-antigen/teichoic acid export membrane protein